MLSNLDRYKKDLDNLLNKGRDLQNSMNYALDPDELSRSAKKKLGDKKGKEFLKTLPSFRDQYQAWYSEAKALIRLLLPDRLEDFVRHYEKPKGRKDLTNESYRIDDYLQGLGVTRQSGLQQVKVVGLEAASPHLRQQVAILTSVKARFESSLFDIRQLVQADLFDSELDATKELAKHKFNRAAGALAGVVLERHLAQVCDNHGTKPAKRKPTIASLNDALKGANVIELPDWRFIQHLGDIRNLCDHSKKSEPSADQVDDLVAGVIKVTKTIF